MNELSDDEKTKIYEAEKVRLEAKRSIEAKFHKKKGSIWAAITLLLFVLIIIAIVRTYTDVPDQAQPKTSVSTVTTGPSTKLDVPIKTDNLQVRIIRFSNDINGNYEALGEVSNTTAKTFRSIKIQAEFLDTNYAVIGLDTTFACSGDDLLPGKTKSFIFKGNNDPKYSWAKFTILSASEVR